MADILALYGSPRRHGNTSTLLQEAIRGSRDFGAQTEEIYLDALNIAPCKELYVCKRDGECGIKDDFQVVRDKILSAKGLMLASPVFFYSVSAQTKLLMDRCQSLWVKKYWVDGTTYGQSEPSRKGLFISVGATRGKKLFDGILLTTRYFFDVLDTDLWRALLYRGLDFEGDVKKHPEYLSEAYYTGRALAEAIDSAT